MTERKLLAFALVVMTGLAVLTGMGTYGFLADSESVGIVFSGNVVGNEAGNAPVTPPGNTATGTPADAGNRNSGGGNQNAGNGAETGNTEAGNAASLPTGGGGVDLSADGRDR